VDGLTDGQTGIKPIVPSGYTGRGLIKGQNSSKRGQNGMKFYHSLEILTNKLQNKFQLDIWKENEIISRKP
jgi:hypothetical protein